MDKNYTGGIIQLPGDGREIQIGEKVIINKTQEVGIVTEMMVGSYVLSYFVTINGKESKYKTNEITPVENP